MLPRRALAALLFVLACDRADPTPNVSVGAPPAESPPIAAPVPAAAPMVAPAPTEALALADVVLEPRGEGSASSLRVQMRATVQSPVATDFYVRMRCRDGERTVADVDTLEPDNRPISGAVGSFFVLSATLFDSRYAPSFAPCELELRTNARQRDMIVTVAGPLCWTGTEVANGPCELPRTPTTSGAEAVELVELRAERSTPDSIALLANLRFAGGSDEATQLRAKTSCVVEDRALAQVTELQLWTGPFDHVAGDERLARVTYRASDFGAAAVGDPCDVVVSQVIGDSTRELRRACLRDATIADGRCRPSSEDPIAPLARDSVDVANLSVDFGKPREDDDTNEIQATLSLMADLTLRRRVPPNTKLMAELDCDDEIATFELGGVPLPDLDVGETTRAGGSYLRIDLRDPRPRRCDIVVRGEPATTTNEVARFCATRRATRKGRCG